MTNGLNKASADRLAELISTKDGAKLWHLLRSMRLLSEHSAADTSLTDDFNIGPWKSPDASGPWVSDPNAPRRGWWCDRETIPPRQANDYRVVLVGESVARGFFYDPEWTPAMVLAQMLQANIPEKDVDVVDLAKTSIDFWELAQLLVRAQHLEPDAIIVFAGNNWSPFREMSSQEGAALLDDPTLNRLVEESKVAFGTAFNVLTSIIDQYVKNGIPCVVIAPESNLDGWTDIASGMAMVAPDSTSELLKLILDIQESAEHLEEVDLEPLVRRLKAFGVGAGSAGWRYLCEAARRRGRWQEARQFAARAAEIGLLPKAPRCAETVRELLTSLSAVGAIIVDLAKIFSSHYSTSLPGKAVFLDYCHLNSTAILLSMAHVSRSLLNHLGAEVEVDRLLSNAERPGAEVEACANFLAALHCDLWGQDRHLVADRLREATSHKVLLLDALRDFLSLGFQNCYPPITAAFRRLIENYGSQIKRYLADQEISCSFRSDLLATSVGLLGPKWNATVTRNLVEKFAPHKGAQINLLEAPFSMAQPRSISHLEQILTHRSRVRTALFDAVLDGVSNFSVEIVYRTPHLREPYAYRRGEITVGGKHLSFFPSRSSWNRITLTILGSNTLPGLNRLEVIWPEPTVDPLILTEEYAEALLRGETQFSPTPIFGEIGRLTIHLAGTFNA